MVFNVRTAVAEKCSLNDFPHLLFVRGLIQVFKAIELLYHAWRRRRHGRMAAVDGLTNIVVVVGQRLPTAVRYIQRIDAMLNHMDLVLFIPPRSSACCCIIRLTTAATTVAAATSSAAAPTCSASHVLRI